MKKILVIEDEAVVRSNTLKILSFEGFEAIGAENGVVGINLAKEQKPDLIVCDIMMPILDGYEVQSTLTDDPETRSIPIIFLTAKTKREDMRLAMNLGADDYLTKPFSRDELLETVFSRLDKQELLQAELKQKVDKLRGDITTSLPAKLFIPLQNIRCFLEKLQAADTSGLPATIQSDLLESHVSAQYLERFLQNFLFYALLELALNDPMEAEALRGQGETLDSTEVITTMAQLKAQEFRRAQDLEIKIESAKLSILEANLAKIVEEVVDNACKFSAPNTVISINSSLDAETMTLSISNECSDFLPPPLFESDTHKQLSQKINGQGGGGLGLSIASRLAQLHQGKLEIKRVSQKVTVEIQLPRVVAQSSSNSLLIEA